MSKRPTIQVLHGGHRGTEAEFGRAAERWGLDEATLSFEGHNMERAHNVELLDDDELSKGRVSLEFVFQRMGRRFVRGKGIRRVLQMMFHLVVRAHEVFAVGWILPTDTVKGGTGWGVELAKLFNRRVHVFDQEKERWFTWSVSRWEPSVPVLPPQGIVAGTGTRNLTEAGRAAIGELFERSLGPARDDETAGARSRAR